MTLRWRKDPKPTGLSAVGAGQYRSSCLYLDDEEDYLATVSPSGGNWAKKFQGWYYSCPSNEEKGIEFSNSYPKLFESEKEAKDTAKKYVLESMAAHKANKGT